MAPTRKKIDMLLQEDKMPTTSELWTALQMSEPGQGEYGLFIKDVPDMVQQRRELFGDTFEEQMLAAKLDIERIRYQNQQRLRHQTQLIDLTTKLEKALLEVETLEKQIARLKVVLQEPEPEALQPKINKITADLELWRMYFQDGDETILGVRDAEGVAPEDQEHSIG